MTRWQQVLQICALEPRMYGYEIAERLGLHGTNITRALNVLREKGYVIGRNSRRRVTVAGEAYARLKGFIE